MPRLPLAIFTAEIMEMARNSKRVSDRMPASAKRFTRADVRDCVAERTHDVQVEATFLKGTKLVTVHDPIQ